MKDTLTIEQLFEFRRMEDASKQLTKQQALKLLEQAQQLLYIKSNILQNFLKQNTVNFSNDLFTLNVEQTLTLQLNNEIYYDQPKENIITKLLDTIQLLMNKDTAIREYMKNGDKIKL